MTPYRLVYFVSHPIQYQAPLLRRIAADPAFDLTVLFGSDFSARAYQDEGFGVPIAWDIPLMDGYRSELLPALRDTGGVSFTSPISRGLHERLRTLKPDAIWIHGYASINSLQAITAAARCHVPVLLRAESWLADRQRSSLKLAFKQFFFKVLSRYVAAVLPIGTHNARYWQHYLPHTPQFLMPYAVDNDWFARKAAEAPATSVRSEFNIHPSRPIILFASKLQERKRTADLLDAFAPLCKDTPAASNSPFLLIVGDGEQRHTLEARAATLGLDADVVFAGFRNQTELPRLFAAASLFVLPSQHEPWGLIVNEALASGCPAVVSSDVGCAPDLLQGPPACGAVFPVADVPALRRILQDLLSTPDQLEHMRITARERMAAWSFDQDLAGLCAALAHVTRRKA